jgi:antitoxin ParD1/3/4
MEIPLPRELEQLINEKVATGKYVSANEVIGEALRLLQERDELRRMEAEGLRREVMIGYEQAKRGEVAPLDVGAIKTQGRERLARKR